MTELALLTRIGDGADPVTSDSPELALTARALKERRLITMPKQDGKWQAEITDAGRFYLEHGHHPDQPEPTPRKQRSAGSEQRTRPAPPPQKRDTAPSTTQPAPQRTAKPPQASPTEKGAALIAEVQQAWRFLRIPNPSDQERSRYRRAFDAARQTTCTAATAARFTADEHDLIYTCTQEKIDAANAQKRLEKDLMGERQAMQEALVNLFTKYADQLPDGTLCSADEVYALMTDEDYPECERLVEALRARDPFLYRYLHEEN